MKKLIVIALAVGLILGLGATGYALVPSGDTDTVSGLLSFNLGSGVVYIKLYKNTQGAGVKPGMIQNGFLILDTLHRIRVLSTCDYGVAANPDFTSFLYDSQGGPGTDPPDGDIMKCRIEMRGTKAVNDASGMGAFPTSWVHVDGGGDINYPAAGPSFFTLWTGSTTAGDALGDRVCVDFKIDLRNQKFPSGLYTINVNYLVYEK